MDAENRKVLIYTTHLSTYGVFQVKNENTRRAYITDVYALAGMMETEKAYEVIKEMADRGQPGNAAFEAGFEAVNSVVGNTGAALTAITLGGQYDGVLADTLGKGTQHLGLALAALQTCYDFTYNFSDDQGKLNTLSNLVKNIAGNAVGYFGSATLQVGFAAVAVFDVVLSEVQSDMMELKLENLGGVYQFYNDVEAPRSPGDWRMIFMKILKENADDPQKAQQLINREVDTFCDRFWRLGYGKVKEIAGISGLKFSFDERTWTKDREILTADYKAHLMDRLQAPMTSARNYLLNQAIEQARRELESHLRSLQRELNKTVKVQIIEQPDKDGKYRYGGYIVRFAPLSADANVKNWTGKMPKGGELNTSFTILGHMQSGAPSKVELYKRGDDTPSLTVPFKVSYPITTILLQSGDKDEQDPEPFDGTQEDVQETEVKEYAWVLKGTRKVEPKDTEGTTRSLSEGSASFTTVSSTSPDVFTVSYTWTKPKDSYKAGEVIKISVSANIDTYQWHGKTDDPYLHEGLNYMSGSIDAWIGDPKVDYYGRAGNAIRLKEEDDEGKNVYSAKVKTDYGKIAIQSESRTISAAFPEGYKEGDTIGIHVTGSGAGKIVYDYAWKKK